MTNLKLLNQMEKRSQLYLQLRGAPGDGRGRSASTAKATVSVCPEKAENSGVMQRQEEVSEGAGSLTLSAPALNVCVRQLNGTPGCFSAPLLSGLDYKLETTSSH